MPKKSASTEMVRRPAASIKPSAPEDLERLRAAMAGPIDTSDIPEQTGPVRRVKRDPAARRRSLASNLIRQAILVQIKDRGITRYQLWKAAREHCVTLPQSAVYEYLDGSRDIGTIYASDLIRASGLQVKSIICSIDEQGNALTHRPGSARPRPAGRGKQSK